MDTLQSKITPQANESYHPVGQSSKNDQDESNEILYFSINQDSTCIALATKSGFKIFSTDPFQLIYESKCGPINIVELLYVTNVILLVGLTEFGDFSPKKVTIWSASSNYVLCSSYPFSSNINVAKINKLRMIIGERNFLHIYSTGDMKIMHTVDVGAVSLGRLALSSNTEKNVWVCFSSSKDEGVVKVYDTLNPMMKCHIKAHKSPILKICLNEVGDRLATCSCKGTIIRIFSLPKGEKILTYKRGINSAFIFCLNFSANSEKLISTSDAGTLHIYDLKMEKEQDKQLKGCAKCFGRAVQTVVGKIMPSDYEDSIGTQGASVVFHGDIMKLSNLVAFSHKSANEAFCFTSDGTYYSFSINYETKEISKIYERNIKELILPSKV